MEVVPYVEITAMYKQPVTRPVSLTPAFSPSQHRPSPKTELNTKSSGGLALPTLQEPETSPKPAPNPTTSPALHQHQAQAKQTSTPNQPQATSGAQACRPTLGCRAGATEPVLSIKKHTFRENGSNQKSSNCLCVAMTGRPTKGNQEGQASKLWKLALHTEENQKKPTPRISRG